MNIDITEEETRKKLSKPTQNSSDLLFLLFSRLLVLSQSQHFPHSLSWLLSPEVLNAMSALANSFISTNNPRIQSLSGSSFKQVDQCLVNMVPCQRKAKILKRPLRVNAGYREDDRSPTTTGIFIGGFLLGGIVIGTLGCIYAPQISKAIAGADRKDLMRKLPKFIYDEEKALEKTRKILTEKIAQLNSAIDDVSSQLRAEDTPNETAVSSDEVEAAI